MKRIIVCSDGTGNTAIKGRGTNVFKLFEAIDLNGHRKNPKLDAQVAIYDDGVGTENLTLLKLIGGAFGWGLSHNVKQLYKELVRIYDPGDEIYVFGFSRGAFTVRTLVGFIGTCGLVDRNNKQNSTFAGLNKSVNDAYKAYRKCYRPWLWRMFGQPSNDAGRTFKEANSIKADVRIKFIGVWDTVDAVGVPFRIADIWNAAVYQFKFSDHDLSEIVDRACHALSIDEDRLSFSPVLWNEGDGETRITQVWFAGVHSNIGGGYPKQGMSLVALDWMLTQAACRDGLRINPIEREYFEDHANVDDKLYEPRTGIGIFYRWKIRDIKALCCAHQVKPKIHLTAIERIAHGTDNYAPGNIPNNANVVFTEPACKDSDLLRRRAEGVEKLVRETPNVSLLRSVEGPMLVGSLSYVVFILSCLGTLLAAAGTAFDFFKITSMPWLHSTASLGVLVIGFLLSLGLVLAADCEMNRVFSSFWYQKQPDLRKALQNAKAEAATARSRPSLAS